MSTLTALGLRRPLCLAGLAMNAQPNLADARLQGGTKYASEEVVDTDGEVFSLETPAPEDDHGRKHVHYAFVQERREEPRRDEHEKEKEKEKEKEEVEEPERGQTSISKTRTAGRDEEDHPKPSPVSDILGGLFQHQDERRGAPDAAAPAPESARSREAAPAPESAREEEPGQAANRTRQGTQSVAPESTKEQQRRGGEVDNTTSGEGDDHDEEMRQNFYDKIDKIVAKSGISEVNCTSDITMVAALTSTMSEMETMLLGAKEA